MEIFVNDLSIHGQFQSTADFHAAFARLTAMRAVAQSFGRELYCNQALLAAEPAPGKTLQQALQGLDKDKLRSAMRWLTKGGPFWDENRRHGSGEWLECSSKVVTDSAIGEAAYRALHGVQCGLVSVTPSDWGFSPVVVSWRREEEGVNDPSAALENWWDAADLENGLLVAEPPINSWDDLRNALTGERFANLVFADNCFKPIVKHPFAKSSAARIHFLLDILDRFASAFDEAGERTHEGHWIYRNFFTGENAWFSDSSESEKNDRVFRQKLTFPDPDHPGETLFCPWHGKARHMTLRLHYHWSGKAGEPVYIVYIGPKLTRR